MGRAEVELPSEMLVKVWMSPPQYRVDPDDLVEEAFSVMQRAPGRHLLVMHDGDLVGVVTDRDLRRPDWDESRPLRLEEIYLIGQQLRVMDVMSENVVTIAADDTIAEAARRMVQNKISCLPVLADGSLVGILTSSELLAALVHEANPRP